MPRPAGSGGALLCAVLALVPAPALSAETHRVVIEKFAFVPADISIRPGDRVAFLNRDLAPHTATGTDVAWDTGALTRGQSAEIAFESAGTFAYFCAFHPHMKARIRVTTN